MRLPRRTAVVFDTLGDRSVRSDEQAAVGWGFVVAVGTSFRHTTGED